MSEQYQNQQYYYQQQYHSTTDPICEKYFSKTHYAVYGYKQCEHDECVNRRAREELMKLPTFADDDNSDSD
jgi:hypothetical protein